MSNLSIKNGRIFIKILQYITPAIAVGYIIIDVMIVNNISPTFAHMFTGCSIFTFCILYCSMKYLNFCIVQKLLLFCIVFNELYNTILCPWQPKYIELAFVTILTILLVWAVIRDVERIRKVYIN